MKIKLLSLAVLAAVSVGSAQAHQMSSIAPGAVHSATSTGELATSLADAGKSVDDTSQDEGTFSKFYFKLASTVNLKASASVNSEFGANTDTYTLTLFKYNPAFGITGQLPINEGSFTFGTTSTANYYGNEVSGDYFYLVSGFNPSLGVDQISLQSHIVAAVPATPTATAVAEPETNALLLAGLGVMGFMVRRRKAA